MRKRISNRQTELQTSAPNFPKVCLVGLLESELPDLTDSTIRTKHIYSDRFIPSRVGTKLDAGFELTSPTRYG